MRLTPAYRLRLVRRDARRIDVALDNLRIGLLKLADRAHGAIGQQQGHYNWTTEDALRDAAQNIGKALGDIDKACGEVRWSPW